MNNFKILKTFLLFNVFFINGYGQKNIKKIDSLSRLIEKNYMEGDLNPHLTLKHVTDLYYISRDAEFYPGLINSVFEESKINCLNGNFDSALTKINEGINLTKEYNDYNMLSKFLLVYQKVLLQLDHLNASSKILKEAEKYTELLTSNDSKLINNIFILLSKADLLIITQDFRNVEEIINIKKKAYLASLKISNSNKYKKVAVIYSLESLAASLAYFGDIAAAREYITLINQQLIFFQDDAFIIHSFIIKGMTEYADKNYDLAIDYFTQALIRSKKNNNTYIQYEIYSLLSASYSELKNFERAAEFSKQYKRLVDSIDIVKKKSGDIHFINKINQKIFEYEDKSFLSRINMNFILLVIILVIFMILCYYKLTSKEGVKFSQNELLTNISESHISLNNEPDTSNFSNKSEMTKKLVLLAKEDINTFQIEFQEVYPTFYKTLNTKYTNLNISDLNFCSLIKMNFGIKEISQYTNSTIRASEARRHRIIKKMNLNNQNELYMVLSTIH